jgi:uncharacterized DUF497 family protein
VSKIEFEWDKKKAELNQKKHGVSFELGTEIFSDPQLLSFEDDRKDYGELREVGIGKVEEVILYVVFTIRGEQIRIISTRKANKGEREAYYEYFKRATIRDLEEDEG